MRTIASAPPATRRSAATAAIGTHRPLLVAGRWPAEHLGRLCGRCRVPGATSSVAVSPPPRSSRSKTVPSAGRAAGSFASAAATRRSSDAGASGRTSATRRWRIVAMHAHELHRVRRDERERAREHSEEDHAERVDVARGPGRQSAGLLRRDVRRGSEHRARLGQRAGVAHARDPEVGDLDALLAVEEDVRGFQVAVHEAALVRVRETAPPSRSRRAASRRRPGAVRPARRSSSEPFGRYSSTMYGRPSASP